MFWDKWIPAKFLVKQIVCGIEVLITEEVTRYFFTIVKKQNNTLDIIEQGVCTELKELPDKIHKDKIPVILCVNGKGIILKKISHNAGVSITDERFLQQYLTGLQLSDFYIQLFNQANNTLFASIQRKEQTSNIIKGFTDAKVELADVIIGVAGILSLTQLFQHYNYLQPNLAKVEMLNGYVEEINPFAENNDAVVIEVDGLSMPASQLLSFACAFSYLTQQTIYASPNPELPIFKQIHSEKIKLKFAFGFFIVFVFAICLFNFLFFSNYFSQTKKLDAELGLYQDKYDKINELLTNYEKKKNLIEETGLLENYFFSKYTDKIAATIPHEVILTDFIFNPLNDKDFEEDSLVNFNKNLVMIKGNCNKSMLINEWVNVLKTQNFIRDVNLEKFLFNNDGNQPNFTIMISTK